MLQLYNVHKHYNTATILKNVSFVINPGEHVGLIGPNGCGKTTLLRIITGQEKPDQGAVSLNPPNLRLGYLQQGQRHAKGDSLADFMGVGDAAIEQAAAQVTQLATAMATASDIEQERLMQTYSQALAELERLSLMQAPLHAVASVLAGLDLENIPLDTYVAHLSGGQKTRLGLARVLLHKPHFLLLDEPTNHLDIQALEWLETWLTNYNGGALIVSHDRTFLDHTINKILDIDPETHTIVEYTGNYSDYIETWEHKRELQRARYKDQQAEIRRIRGDITRTRNQALRIELSTTPRTPGPRRYAKKVAKKAKARERKLDRYLESGERVEKPTLTWQMKLIFKDTPTSGQDVLTLQDVAVGYQGKALVSGVNQVLRAGERVALLGPNGAGKTTLLRAIAGKLPLQSGQIRLGTNVKLGYYAQEQETLEPTSTPYNTIAQVAAMSETDVRSFLHYFLFSGDEAFAPIERLSYGERARLVLARLVASGCNLLLLDEPINHLDIPSRSKFEQAMQAYQGAVLAVVHDRYFIQRFASHLWAIHVGQLRRYVSLEKYAHTQKLGAIGFFPPAVADG